MNPQVPPPHTHTLPFSGMQTTGLESSLFPPPFFTPLPISNQLHCVLFASLTFLLTAVT